MRTHSLRPNLILPLACLLAVALFLLGITGPGSHIWGRFLIPIVMVFLWGSRSSWRRDIYIITALGSVLVVVTYWTDGATTLEDLLVNHLAPLAILLAAAWLLARQRQLQEQLAHSEHELDAQVTGRTAALKAREEQLAKIFDANPGGIAITRQSDGCFVAANDAYLAMVGYTRDQLVGRSLVDLGILSLAAREQVREVFRERGSIRGFDLQLMNSDGVPVDMLFSLEQIDFDGEPCYLGLVLDVSERKAAERALRASEERFASLFNSSPVGLALTRLADGLFREVNAAFAAMIGYSRAEMIGRTSAELGMISPADRARLAASLQEQGSFREVDIVLRTREGVLLNTLFSIDLIDHDGEPWMLSSIVDVTERKRLEDRLRDSEERFRLIVQNSPDVIALYNEHGTLTYISPTLEITHGYTAEHALAVDPLLVEALNTPPGEGPRAEELAHVRARPQFADRLKAAEAVNFCLEHPGVQQRVELSNTLLSEEIRYFDIAYRAHRRADGSRQVISITRDVTERKRAEAAAAAAAAELSAANQRLKLAVDAANIGIWAWNFADGSLEWDERMCELYAVPPELRNAGLYYEVWRTRVHPDDRDLAEPAGGDAVQSRSPWTTTFRIVLPDGAVRYIQVNSVKEFDRDGQPWRMIGVNRDITDQIHYEQVLQDTNAELEDRVIARTAELRAALTELQRANQLKDEFLAMISHELRTPLTGVLSMAEMLEDQIAGPLNNRQAYYVKGIGESGARLLAVVNGILSYTHLLSGKVQLSAAPCELAYLLATCAASQQHKAVEKRQTIAVQVTPPDLTITSDATALAEVLKRLLDNAVKFTTEGGCIGLEACPGTAAATVHIAVWDTGIGIPAEQHEHVFRAFTQADASLARQHEGIGLGLAYVDEMVRLLGGTISLASTPGRGSRFTITLPA